MDILNLARIVENQNVSGWKGIEGDWDTMISNIEYKYQVRSQITKSFILGNNKNNE
jgi:spore germination protein KC